jgi:hypothetical protein
MGFVRRIGRALSRGVGRVFRKVTDFAKSPIKALKTTFKSVIAPFKDVVKGLLKNPLGTITNIAKGFLGNFLKNPLSGVLTSVLGPFGGIVGGILSNTNLLGLAKDLVKTPAYQHPQGGQNLQNILINQFAKNFF